MPKKVEIITIIRNRPKYYQKVKDAMSEQTFKDFKWTIFDNKDNESLADITSRLFSESDAELVGKLDDDMLVPPDWLERLVEAHDKYHFGFIGGFHFREEEMQGVEPNITEHNGVKIWEKGHIGGNFLMRRKAFKPYEGEGVMGLSDYQHLSEHPNGYLYPFIITDHMQDGRSKHCIRGYENKFGMGTDDYTKAFIRDSKPYLNVNTI